MLYLAGIIFSQTKIIFWLDRFKAIQISEERTHEVFVIFLQILAILSKIQFSHTREREEQ